MSPTALATAACSITHVWPKNQHFFADSARFQAEPPSAPQGRSDDERFSIPLPHRRPGRRFNPRSIRRRQPRSHNAHRRCRISHRKVAPLVARAVVREQAWREGGATDSVSSPPAPGAVRAGWRRGAGVDSPLRSGRRSMRAESFDRPPIDREAVHQFVDAGVGAIGGVGGQVGGIAVPQAVRRDLFFWH